jgi:uncharacterized protein YdeI (YjbR/CyaY-like superfamily)
MGRFKNQIINLPPDVIAVLKKNPKAKQFFDLQNFSNRREYVEWIITAKREKTRQQRLSGMIERLLKGFKNPAGRN